MVHRSTVEKEGRISEMTIEERRNRKYEPRVCLVCGWQDKIGEDFCENCGWIWDSLQEKEPDYAMGMNDMSLNMAREAYKQGIPIH